MYKIETAIQAFISMLALIGSFVGMACSFLDGSATLMQTGSVILFVLIAVLNCIIFKELLKGE